MKVQVARVGKPHGIRGEVTVQLFTDAPEERFAPGARLLLEPPVALAPGGVVTVRRARWNKAVLVVALEEVADRNGAKALVTGENLGQVASQTMEALGCTEAVTRLPVLRPLIGFDKEEIVRIARHVGTFDTSILPYEDCCTVFTPKHPNTKPKMPKILEAESHLDVEALVDEAVKGVEIIHLP